MTRIFLRRFVLLLSIAYCGAFIACDGATDKVVVVDEDDGFGTDGKNYVRGSRESDEVSLALKGDFLLVDSLVPVKLKITVVDEHLDSLKSFDAKIQKNKDGSYSYSSDKAKYPQGYAKLAYTCQIAGSDNKMEFVQYADLNEDSSPLLNVFESLESERVEALVQNENFYLQQAKRKSLREIYRLLDCEIQASYMKDPAKELWRLPYVYARYEVASSGKRFYESYGEMRSSLGSGKTWRDFESETEIVDSLYSRYKKGVGPWNNKVSAFDNDYRFFASMWADYYGLGTCSRRGDTTKVANKESAFYKNVLVCDERMISKNSWWRPLNSMETMLGLCLKDSSVVHDSLAYHCDAEEMLWSRISLLDGVKLVYGKCTKDMLGEVVTYGESEATCLCSDAGVCDWKEGVPDGSVGKYTPVDAFVKKSAGECTEKRESERIALQDSFYICKSGFWEKTDKVVYTWGVCESSRKGEIVYEKGLGAFKCGYELSGTGAWTWLDAPLPEYHKDVCEEKNENEIKTYDDLYYVCNGTNWRAAADSELVAPVLQGFYCIASNEDEVKEIDGEFYACKSYKWNKMNPYEIQVHKARIKHKIPEDYCKSGIKNTTITWDDDDQALYGCGKTSADHKKFRWMRYVYRGETSMHYIAGKNKVEGILSDWNNLAGGMFTSDGTYEVEFEGVRYIFGAGSFRSNSDDYGNLYESLVVVDGVSYKWLFVNGKNTVRMPIGSKYTTLDSLENKSESFTGFYEKWMEQIIESSTCPNTIDESIPCAKQTMSGLDDVDVLRYGKNSYTTLEQARLQVPSGFHIPDTAEWKTIIPKSSALESSLEIHQYEDNQKWKEVRTRYNLFWTSSEKDKDTQYCFEYIREVKRYDATNFYFDERFVVASRVVECPKDLYPMVQVLYVSDEEL